VCRGGWGGSGVAGRGVAPRRLASMIPKSVNPERLRENLAAANVELTDDVMRDLTALDRARRYIDGTFWVHEGGPYTLANLWDGE